MILEKCREIPCMQLALNEEVNNANESLTPLQSHTRKDDNKSPSNEKEAEKNKGRKPLLGSQIGQASDGY